MTITSYAPGYSFAGWQAVNPDEPLPAVEVDGEFSNISTSVLAIIAAVDQVRRADGNLQNGVVTWDGLGADLQAMITNLDDRMVVGDINPSAFATQAEAEAGVANDKLMTPLRSAQAVTAQRAYASQAEAQTGSNNTKVLTPLRGTELVDAKRPYASQAEAEAGTENTKVLTALRVAQALAALRPAFTGQANLTWGAIAAGASATQTITVTGAAANDRVALGLPAAGLAAGLIPQAWVSSANTVTVRITNVTGGSLTPHSGVATQYDATAMRF